MAQEIVKKVASREVAERNSDKANVEADVARSLAEFLRSYSPDLPNKEKDILNRHYRIDLNSPLPDFDCQTAKAYGATNEEYPEKQYVAQVCGVGTLQRMEAIAPLINSPHPNLMHIVSAGVVELSRLQEERFVIIYERPKGKKLSALIATMTKRPSFEYICQYIISPLALVIQHLSEMGLPHGSINCDNIYFYDTAVLGGFAAEPCGLSQDFSYEPLERMQALPAGKGTGDGTQDYYALAVVVLHIIYGNNHFGGMSEEALILQIMKEGAFNALTRQKDMPEVFYDFFRGLLGQNPRDRWGYKYLKAWLDGKRYNVMPTPPPQEAIRPFEFAGGFANTRREVANLLANNWSAVPDVICSGQLSSWVVISLRNKELNEYLVNMAKAMNAATTTKKNNIAVDEQIMRVITIFDQAGPVRIQKSAFHIDGFSTLFADLMLKSSLPEMQLLMRFIELSMFNFIIEQKNKENEKRDESEGGAFDDFVTKFERLRGIIRNTGIGFGAERVFYDLNPKVQCISPLLSGKYVATLPALLKTLDQLAPTLSKDKNPIDPHIAAFIASQIGINHEIYLTGLDTHPLIAKDPAMIALKLLAAAQRKASISHLPGISHWLALKILPLLGEIRSKTLKRKLVTLLEKMAKSGNLIKMADIFIESGYTAAEESAFQQAMRRYKINASDIIYYKRQDVIEAQSKRLGTKMAHYVAVAALAFSFYIALRGGGYVSS